MKRLPSVLLAFVLSLQVAAHVQPRVTFVTSSIVRVQWSSIEQLTGNGTAVCVYEPQKVKVSEHTRRGITTYRTSELIVELNHNTGSLRFVDRHTGRTLLNESTHPRLHEEVIHEQVTYDEASARIVETANGKVTIKDVLRRDTIGLDHRYRCHFELAAGEAIYGLGAHMEDYMNLRGKTLYLCQHNLKVMVPMLQSTAGYGLLFDVGCAMIYADTLRADGSSLMTIQMEAAHEVDYYFMKGHTMDHVVAQYRYLTGSVPLLPVI